MDKITNCTRCTASLDEFRIEVKLNTNVHRKKESGDWENLPNMNIVSREVLCKSCFDKFAIALSKGMELK